MIETNLFKYYKVMRDKNIILSFKGTVSQEILVSIGSLIKDKLSREICQQRVTKKVFSIFIELAQNVLHYSAEKMSLGNDDKKAGMGIVVVSEDDDYYKITSGNLIKKSMIKQIVDRCNYINKLDSEELKIYFKEQRRLPRGDSVGGGIGLIDVARKSGYPLDFQINSIDEPHSFFVLSAKVEKEN